MLNVTDVLADIFSTSLCLSLRGLMEPEEYRLLQSGIGKVRGFIHSENYNLDSAIVNASKAAYLSKLIEHGITEVKHFNPAKVASLADEVIIAPLSTKLSKLKKSNIEAFFYWTEVQKLM